MILVTGGTGLVGAHLLLHLTESGESVRSLYRDIENIQKTKGLFIHYKKQEFFDRIEWVQADILDLPSLEDAFANITHVYHCAAHISFNPSEEEKLRKTNIEGTANMVNCALHFGVKKFCHVSSVAALGDLREGETYITEETEWNPEQNHSDYAISKYGAETEVWRAWQEGLEVVIVNPGLIFGYGFWNQGSGEVFKAIDKGQYFYTKGSCGIVAVKDVVQIMVKLMRSNINGERFTLVAEDISYQDLFNTIADGMKKKRPAIYATPLMTSFAWRADWLLSKLFFQKRKLTRSMARSAHKNESFDSTKIIKALDYNFINMKDYIREIAKDY